MSLFSHYPSEGARVRFTQTRLLCIQFNYSLRRSWRRYDNWILDIGRVLFLFRIFMDGDEVEVYENSKKKNETNTRQTSNHHDWTSLVNNGFIIKQRNFALSRMKYNWFISRAGKEKFDFFLPLFATSSLILSKNYELYKFARDQSGKSRSDKRDPSFPLG